jgi:uncharacterized protein
MRKDVSFYSDGNRIAAHLYLPEESGENMPAVILCHGFAGVKELLIPDFAEHFRKNGYAALCFDYRGFGESEGERGRLIPDFQIRDICNAVSFMQSREEVDSFRIGLWGTSFGGANAIVAAARDNRIRCLCVQLTFGSGYRVITGTMKDEERVKFLATIGKMREKKTLTNREMMVPVNKVLTDEQSKEFYKTYVTEYPALELKIPFLTVAETLSFIPENHLCNCNIPIHITGAGQDQVNPPMESFRLHERAPTPKSLYMVENRGHYEIYHGDVFKEVVRRQTEWFDRYLNQ